MTMAILPKLRSVGKNLTANVDNTVYTCPNNHTAKIVLVFVANETSGNKTIHVDWYDSSATSTYTIIGGYTISGYGYLTLDQSYLVLNQGDSFIIKPEAGSTMSATLTVEEFFDPSNQE